MRFSIITALTDRRARKLATEPLIAHFREMTDAMLKDRTANALATCAPSVRCPSSSRSQPSRSRAGAATMP